MFFGGCKRRMGGVRK